MNALVGKVRPGDFGVDVMHLNLHKTFSTPHGGGGPGSGPVAIKKILEPFLPTPVVDHQARRRPWASNTTARNRSAGCALSTAISECSSAPWPTFWPTVRTVCARPPKTRCLNANYIRKGLEGVYDLPYSTPSMHEVVFSDKMQAKKGVKTMDIAKRLIDYGFHPYTTAFPLIVPGALDDRTDRERTQRRVGSFCRSHEVDRGRS